MDLTSVLHHHHQEIMASHPHCQSLDNMIICSKQTPTRSQQQQQQQPPQNQHDHHLHQENNTVTNNQLDQQQQQQQTPNQQQQQQQDQKKPRPPDHALNCPRCDSANTKFCYYNNYSLSQPRYFCKSCRRYWTKGGTLRNVPVGGGCRKNNKRFSSSSNSSSSNTSSSNSSSSSLPSSPSSLLLKRSLSQDLENHHHHMAMMAAANSSPLLHHLPFHHHDSSSNGAAHDLSLAFARLQHKLNAGGGGGHLGGGFDGNSIIGSLTPGHDTSLLGQLHGGGGGDGGGSFMDSLKSATSAGGSGMFLDLQHPQNTNTNAGGMGFQNLFYGFGTGAGDDNNNNGLGGGESAASAPISRDMGILPYNNIITDTTTNAMKQEEAGGNAADPSRVLWGFPWQINNGSDHHGSGRATTTNTTSTSGVSAFVGGNGSEVGGQSSWNGVMGANSTTWYGLLNSPLM